MLVKELLDKKVPFEVIQDDDSIFATSAKIGNRYIIFFAGMEEEGEWEIEFKESKDNPRMGGTYDLTGSGNELAVFSMIKDSIKELIARHKPKMIVFTASKSDGSSKRADTYERLLKKFVVPGYTFDRKDVSHEPGDSVQGISLR
jgi:hypothetical protein